MIVNFHAAKEKDTVKPICSSPGGAVRGCVPVMYKSTESLAAPRAQAAAADARAHASKGLSFTGIAT
jgi:hypothetical protein